MQTVYIPTTVTSIGEFAFFHCETLTSVVIPEGVQSIEYASFYFCTSLENVTIPSTVKTIDEFTFSFCCSLVNVVIPEGVKSIGYVAFQDCKSLTNMTIPSTVTEIGENAFNFCHNLERFDVANNNTALESIDGVLFDRVNKTLINYPPMKTGNYTIPDGMKSIEGDAFAWCRGLTNVTIPVSVEYIDMDSGFYGCDNLMWMEVNENNQNYTSIDGVLIQKEGMVLLKYPSGREDTNYTIPDEVNAIGDHAFHLSYYLTKITIPHSVTSIVECAFRDCNGLTNVDIPDSVISIGYNAFSSCYSLRSVTIPHSVDNIGSDAFLIDSR